VKGKVMVYILLADGFEEIEALTQVDYLRRAGIDIVTVGIGSERIVGAHSIPVICDTTVDKAVKFADRLEMVILPGGLGGVASARASQPALDALRFAWDNGKFVAAICAGPTVLADLGITDGKHATCYPGCEDGMGNAIMAENAAVVADGRLITGTSAGCAIPFGLKLIEVLKGKEAADQIAAQIVIR
jgi:4-methyl-5(b-hydroxyethyl)-thiazole monophosphate biosynthesis